MLTFEDRNGVPVEFSTVNENHDITGLNICIGNVPSKSVRLNKAQLAELRRWLS